MAEKLPNREVEKEIKWVAILERCKTYSANSESLDFRVDLAKDIRIFARETNESLVNLTRKIFEAVPDLTDSKKFGLSERIIGEVQSVHFAETTLFLIKVFGEINDPESIKNITLRFCKLFDLHGFDAWALAARVEVILGLPHESLKKELEKREKEEREEDRRQKALRNSAV